LRLRGTAPRGPGRLAATRQLYAESLE